MAERHAPVAAEADAGQPAPASGGSGPPRERGWGRILSALAAFLLVPATPLLRTVVPIEETWLLLFPALAACTLLGWRFGGRAALAVLWCALAYWVLSHPPGASARSYELLAAGWGFLLSGAFGLVYLLGRRRRFFPAALSGIGLALAVALAVTVASGEPAQVTRMLEQEYTVRNVPLLTWWDRIFAPQVQQAVNRTPEMIEALDETRARYQALPSVSAVLAPAMLALESLAALALAWGLYHRMSRVRIGPPLAPLRQFRFNDQLIWGLIVGVTLVVLPTLAAWRGVGANLILFFGTLYALRGVGVLSYFLAPGWLTALTLTVLAPMLWPFYAVGALGLGLGDTWLDWRRRPRSTTPS